MPRRLSGLVLALSVVAAAPVASGQGDTVQKAGRDEVAAVASVIEVPEPGSTAGDYDLAPGGRSVRERLDELQRKVQAAAQYPAVARKRGVSGESLVSFEIGSDGVAREAQTLRSSGSLLLDRAALRAVEQAAPLPWIYGRVAVPVRFSLRDAD